MNIDHYSIYGTRWGARYRELLALAEAGLPAMIRLQPVTIEEA